MNTIYRVIWNRTLSCFVVTSELASGRTQSKSGSVKKPSALRGAIIAALALSGMASHSALAAGTNGQLLVDGGLESRNGYNIATAPANQAAIIVSNSGELTYNAAQATTSGAGASTALVQSGSTLNMDGSSLSSFGINSYGIMLSGGSTANLQNTSISQFGATGSVGINVSGNSVLNASDLTINSPYVGMQVTDSKVDITNLNIATRTANARGIAATGADTDVTIDGGSINTAGSAAHAVYAGYDASVKVSNMAVTTTGAGQAGSGGAAGLFADTGGKIQAENLTINTNSNAIWLRVSTLDGNNLHINQNTSANGPAIWTYGGSVLNLTNSDIALVAAQSQAMSIDGGVANLDNVTVTGDNGGSALQVRFNGTLYGKNINVAINNSYATPEDTREYAGLTLSRGAGNTFARLEDSSIVVKGTDANGVLADIGVQRAELSNTLVAADTTAVKVSTGASLALSVSGSTLTAPTLLSGGMTSATAGAGNVYLDASNGSVLSGDVLINRAMTNDSRLTLDTGSSWLGASHDLNTLSLSNHSQWNISADSNVATLNLADSTVAFSHDGESFNTLTVDGDFNSNNGTLVMNSVLGNDGAAHDRLIVSGNTSGNTNVAINKAGGSGAQTLQGIEVISVAGNSDGNFVQQGRIVAGAYDYRLMRGNGAAAKNWYLMSNAAAVVDPVDPINPVSPIVPVVRPVVLPVIPAPVNMVVRPEAGSYLANMAAARDMFSLRLHDRGGETQYVDAVTGEKKVTSLWMRNLGGHNQSTDSSGQLKTQTNRYVLQLGGDIGKWTFGGEDILHIGTMAGYGNAQSNTDSGVNGLRSQGQVNGYSVGLYGSWYQNEAAQTGAYLDSWAQYGWFNNSVKGDGLTAESYKSQGVSASLEGGYSWKLGEDAAKNSYFIEPNAQLAFSNIKADEVRESNGTQVSSQGNGNVQSHVGVRASMKTPGEGKQAVFKPYLEANWIANSQNTGATMNGVSIEQRGSKNIAEVRGGVDGQLTQRVSLWGNVGQQMGSASYRDTNASVGLKVSF